MVKVANVSVEYLRELFTRVDDADAVRRLAAAIAYKEVDGLTQTDAARLYGFSSGWASHWFERLERLEDEPFEDVLFDEPRSGRPPKLPDDRKEQFEAALEGSPDEVGLDGDAWTVALASRYLEKTFDVEYSDRHVRRLLREAGLSWKSPDESDEDDGSVPDRRRTIWTMETRS